MKRVVCAFALVLSTLSLAACEQSASDEPETAPAQKDTITVENARLVLPAVSGNPAGVFFDLANTGDVAVTLEGVSIEGAGSTMIHDVKMEDGIVSMFMIPSAEIAPGQTLAFAPGGKHVMAMKLDDTVAAGNTVKVTLEFAGAEPVEFDAPVQAFGQEK